MQLKAGGLSREGDLQPGLQYFLGIARGGKASQAIESGDSCGYFNSRWVREGGWGQLEHEGGEGLPSMPPREDEGKKGLLGNLEALGVKELGRENEGLGCAEAGDDWEASGTALPVLPHRQISEGGKIRIMDCCCSTARSYHTWRSF